MAEASSAVVPVEQAAEKPYSFAIAYPAPEQEIVQSRIRQLQDLGVSSLVFEGPLKFEKISLLGKGVAAMVVAGLVEGRRVALKIRRLDSRRQDMFHESKMLQAANQVGVGPEHVGVTSDILAMELVNGLTLPLWLSGMKGRGRRKNARMTVGRLFEQCRQLDSAGLDHGELARAHKNVLVAAEGRPWIVDFESASFSRRPANVTCLSQYLFLGGGFARRAKRVLGQVDRESLLRLLRGYKHGDLDAYGSALRLLKLD